MHKLCGNFQNADSIRIHLCVFPDARILVYYFIHGDSMTIYYQRSCCPDYISLGGESQLGSVYSYNAGTKTDIGTEFKQGFLNPNHKIDIIKKRDASTNYKRTWFRNQPGSFFAEARRTSGNKNDYVRYWGWTSSLSYRPTSDYNDAVVRDIALTKIKRKIASDKEDYAVLTNLVQDVYEFRRTINGTLDSILGLSRNVTKLLRGRGSVASLLLNVSELYLSWVFGINPTIQDAKDLGKSIDAYIKRTDHFKRFQAYHWDVTSDSGLYQPSSPFGMFVKFREQSVRKYSCKYISGHYLDLRSGNNYGLCDHFHLAPTDFIPLAWELLPWSWFLDYFFTIGPFLTDTFQSTVNTSVYNTETLRSNVSWISHVEVTPRPGWAITSFTNSPKVVQCGDIVRNKTLTLPGRILRFRTPYELNLNAVSKSLNVLAVLASRSLRR